MNRDDHDKFKQLLESVYSFYRADLTQFHIEVWWNCLRAVDFDGAKEAFNRHVMNPDTGQFCPKPADIVKLIGGGTVDRALLAWSKFELAVQHIGSWDTVVFDDPIIHQVVDDMGGWVALCGKTEKEWPFVRNEFVQRYRGYATRAMLTYPAKLIGQTEAYNAGRYDHAVPAPKYIGNESRARKVLEQGANSDQRMRKIGELLPQQPKLLERE